jgi:hypothetical protein
MEEHPSSGELRMRTIPSALQAQFEASLRHKAVFRKMHWGLL